MKVKIRITNGGQIGGFTAEVCDHGQWRRVNRYIGAGLVAFDTRAAAIKAAELEAKKMVAHDRECERAAMAVIRQRPTAP